ncbi:MAG: hypothetical protein PHY16_02510 [Methylobacter sp.]|nr:hypothetical protein [Methylobacter sp.]
MIISKVIRDNRRHITQADYNNTKPLLSSENVIFPKIGSLESRVLWRLFAPERMLSHREFDFSSHSYRLGGYIGFLRDKGWTIVNHDEAVLTKDFVPRKVIFTRYVLFAEFTQELGERVAGFCKEVDEFEDRARVTATTRAKMQMSDIAKSTHTQL